ncbi:penicillin-insensitive murein endopeptidase [Zooshikella ganghwensis]|uniref:Penicillin-insensitive murein endopeptidase n=2 Tax=Zooshikella ganghwensis TaxID=202772 RepID=A0A4P9VLQ6_9GAMM|nr:penicillin-insensitive murein endopeptidase [Zooshikella ganghwensis]
MRSRWVTPIIEHLSLCRECIMSVKLFGIPSLLLSCSLITVSAFAASKPSAPWLSLTVPNTGKSMAIGSYAAGCLAGGESLPPNGKGFQVMRLSRARFYGHPELIRYINDLGGKIADRQLGTLLVGDLAMARGGPMEGGHRSHQNGLDVDIWFTLDKKHHLDLYQREALSAFSVIQKKRYALDTSRWTPKHDSALQSAAQDGRVERIFVAPLIKKRLCTFRKNKQDDIWLRKIRPWWGHDDHFHVRLKCPSESPFCRPQKPIPAGNGCDKKSLKWWLTVTAQQHAKAQKAKKVVAQKKTKKKGKPFWQKVKLPEMCHKVFADEARYLN